MAAKTLTIHVNTNKATRREPSQNRWKLQLEDYL